MTEIILNKDEFSLLSTSSYIPREFVNYLNTCSETDRIYLLRLPEDIVEELRDLFIEQLQISGFDEQYRLTAEGKILEQLIDKFYLG
jgi:hypothetical protein